MNRTSLRALPRVLLRTRRYGAALAAVAGAVALTVHPSPGAAADWPMFGQNLNNTASNVTTMSMNKDVTSLQVKWTFTTGGDVSARAAIFDGIVYFPDWAGNLYALSAST